MLSPSHDPSHHFPMTTLRRRLRARGAAPATYSLSTLTAHRTQELPHDVEALAIFRNHFTRHGAVRQTRGCAAGPYGRLIHSEQQSGGVVDPETVHDFAYDT